MRLTSCARKGLAQLTIKQAAGQSVAVHSVSRTPIKLLVPQPRGQSVWAYLSSFGGGMLAGDQATINVEVGEGASGFLTTQSATKIYVSPQAVPAGQSLQCEVDEGGFLAVVPDPVQCYAGSVYEQRQTFRIAANSGLVFVDALSAGRTARNERWAFTRFFSRTEVFVDKQRACLDALLLDSRVQDCSTAMGRFNSCASVLLLGDKLAEPCARILAEVAERPIAKRQHLLVSASQIRHGALLRVASENLETLTQEIHRHLSFLIDFLGDDPLARKW